MTNWNFNRRLTDNFVESFNKLYDDADGQWLKGLVDDPDMFFAIRDNCVNFYYRGCSLLKLEWAPMHEEKLVGHIHYKYLLNPSRRPEYVRVVNGVAELPERTRVLFLESIDVPRLKKTVSRYAEAEKTGVHKAVMSEHDRSVLDVEIAFGGVGSAPRIDIATLQDTDFGPTLMFFEAKHFKNKDLRAARSDDPAVIRQMKGYAKKLKEHKTDIAESYRRVCKNLLALRGVCGRMGYSTELLDRVANRDVPLTVNVEPGLVVFGYDDDQRYGKTWVPHRDKLERILKGRVLFKGDPKGIAFR